MTEHFTRSTVSAQFYCPKCKKATQHRIDDCRKGPCLECIARLTQAIEDRQAAENKLPKPVEQGKLFA